MARICAGQCLRLIALLLATSLGVVYVSAAASAAEARAKSSRAKADAKGPAVTVEMFDGMKSGDLEVKLVAMDATKGNVMISNKTNKPISVQLPKAFAGVPVLAQFRPGGLVNPGNGGGARGQVGANGMNQGMGGGFGQGTTGLNGNNGMNMNGMNFGMNNGGMNNGGIMNIPPEKTAKIKVPLVCLEHGKADPRASVPYEIKPIDSFTKNVAVQQLCAMLGEGKVEQRVAQIAAWHLANGLSYDELATKQLEEFGSQPRPFFTSQEMKNAESIIDQAEERAEQVGKETKQNVADKSPGSGDVSAVAGTADATTDDGALATFGEAVESTVTKQAVAEKPAPRRRIRSR